MNQYKIVKELEYTTLYGVYVRRFFFFWKRLGDFSHSPYSDKSIEELALEVAVKSKERYFEA